MRVQVCPHCRKRIEDNGIAEWMGIEVHLTPMMVIWLTKPVAPPSPQRTHILHRLVAARGRPVLRHEFGIGTENKLVEVQISHVRSWLREARLPFKIPLGGWGRGYSLEYTGPTGDEQCLA